MHMRVLTALTLVLVLSSPAIAQTWTAPDGFLSITPPDANKFQLMESPPAPFVGLWVSQDQTMKFGLMKMEVPSNIRIIQSSVEQGLAEEVGGEVTRLPSGNVSGHEVWSMTAKGPSIEITQAMVRHEDAVYKLMAASVGAEPDADAVREFMDSISIAAPSQSSSPVASPSGPLFGTARGEGDIVQLLSKRIGGVGALLGIGLLVYLLMRGKNGPNGGGPKR